MLTLICGLSRAGKTTYSKQFEDRIKVLHLDRLGYKEVARRINRYADVVVEGIYNTRSVRKYLLHSYNGDKARCIWLNTPTEIRKTRNGYSPKTDIPFEPPTEEEGWDEIIVIGDTDG